MSDTCTEGSCIILLSGETVQQVKGTEAVPAKISPRLV